MQRFVRTLPGRTLAVLNVLVMNVFACGSSYLPPEPGFADYQRLGFIEVPGGAVLRRLPQAESRACGQVNHSQRFLRTCDASSRCIRLCLAGRLQPWV